MVAVAHPATAVLSRVGVIGTGAMDLGVATSLVRNGVVVGSRDILPRAEAAAAAASATVFPTPAALVRDHRVVICWW